jgi:dTDP-4-amino-4,6-dideoxygalactose transaminase
MRVPFVDLAARYNSIKPEIDSAISKVISASAFIGGEYVTAFEKEFASYIGTDHCTGCANGTDAIELLLTAHGIGPGDEVIVPALTWISTAEAVNNVGATPVFSDVLAAHYTIDPALVSKNITPKTKAIIPVHLYGQPADMDPILTIAKKHDLIVIEDCAQAHGATYKGKRCGSLGHSSSFSFYPGKNLGAFGDAGAMLTNDKQIAEKVRLLANHGQVKKHDHRLIGRNSRLDGLQAAVLSVHLTHLDKWNAERKKAAALYHSWLDRSSIHLPVDGRQYEQVFHLYVIRCDGRDALAFKLKEAGIETAVHYPKPLPMLDVYGNAVSKDFPVSAECCDTILSLPIYPGISEEQVRFVCEHVAKHCGK